MNKNELLQYNGNLMLAFIIAEEKMTQRIGSKDLESYSTQELIGFINRATDENLKSLFQAEVKRRQHAV